MNRYVIIVAGGRGLRMGGSLPKQFIPLEGKPVLMHTLETFHRWDATARLVLVLPADQQSYWAMLCREIAVDYRYSCDKSQSSGILPELIEIQRYPYRAV